MGSSNRVIGSTAGFVLGFDFAWLKSVSEAVGRIDNGSYFECLSCGRDIDEETLDAVPWVAFCPRCAK